MKRIFILFLMIVVLLISCSPDKRIIGKYSDYLISYEFFNNNKMIYMLKNGDYESKIEYKWKKENGKYYKKYKSGGEYIGDWKLFDIEYISTNQIRIDNSMYYYTIDGVKIISVLDNSPDSRFIGNYSEIFGPPNDYMYIAYEFFTNNQIRDYSVKNKNGNRSEPTILMYEWKKEGDTYYKRLWNNSFSEWRVLKLEYINDEEIKIDDITYTK